MGLRTAVVVLYCKLYVCAGDVELYAAAPAGDFFIYHDGRAGGGRCYDITARSLVTAQHSTAQQQHSSSSSYVRCYSVFADRNLALCPSHFNQWRDIHSPPHRHPITTPITTTTCGSYTNVHLSSTYYTRGSRLNTMIRVVCCCSRCARIINTTQQYIIPGTLQQQQ